MGVVLTQGVSSESLVVGGHELRGVGIGGLHRGDALETELLHESILQREERTLDTALCLRRAGADDVDVQLRQASTEVPHPLCLAWLGCVDPKDAGLVAVKGHGLFMAFEVRPRRREVAECRLRRNESKFHQATRRIIHVDEQRAPWGSVLEPLVIAAFDLDQLPQAGTTAARLVKRCR